MYYGQCTNFADDFDKQPECLFSVFPIKQVTSLFDSV